MEEWREYKIGDLCTISSSKRIFANEYQSFGIPFYRGKEIIEKHSGSKISNELYISETRYEEIKKKYGVPQEGDLLLTSVGTLGIPYVVRDEEFYFKDGNLTWFYNFGNLNNHYLYYWFLSTAARHLIDTKAIGSTQKALTIETLKKFEIKLPSIQTQKQIVDVLKSLDDKIEVNRRINDNLEQQAQALFKSWFVDFEPFKDGEFVESELGRIPKGWRVAKIKDIPHTLNTGKRPKGGAITSGVPSIGAEQLKGLCNYDYTKTKYISKEFSQSIPKGKVIGYEVYLNRVGGKPGDYIQNTTMFGEGYPYENCYINDHVFKLDFMQNRGYNVYVYFTFLTSRIQKYLNACGGKAAIPVINKQNIDDIYIFLPENEYVKKFGEIVLPMINMIFKIGLESARLATLRDTLLPKLMSGELSVNDIKE